MTVANVTSTTIRVTWDEVPAIERNGIITEYEVEYNQSTFDINTTQTVTVTSTMAELTGLHEYVDYFIRVRACTRVGAGPYTADMNTTTAEDGRYTFEHVSTLVCVFYPSSAIWFPSEHYCHHSQL